MSTSSREDTPEQNLAASSQLGRSPAEHICSRKKAKMPRRSAGRKWHLSDSLGSTWQGLQVLVFSALVEVAVMIGIALVVRGRIASSAYLVSGVNGAFQVPGLRPGPCRLLLVAQPALKLPHRHQLLAQVPRHLRNLRRCHAAGQPSQLP